MSKGLILYCSQHHGNTEKLVKEACKNYSDMEVVSLMNESSFMKDKLKGIDLSEYDTIGFASGVYMAKPHDVILNYIENNKKVLHNKNIFLILTSGSNQKSYGKWFASYIGERGLKVIDCYQCKGWDSYGLWRFIGGIAKKHPNQKDIEACQEFLNASIA